MSSKTVLGAQVGANLTALPGPGGAEGASAGRREFPELLKRPRGRPKGTKDSKPRKVSTASHTCVQPPPALTSPVLRHTAAPHCRAAVPRRAVFAHKTHAALS